MGKANSTGYSADVSIWLECAGRKIPLTHTSANYVITPEAINLPPCDAEIIFKIDGERYSREVWLEEGMSVQNREVKVTTRGEAAPF